MAPKCWDGRVALKCVSLNTACGSTGFLAQHGPSGSANPGITFIMLQSSLVFVSFASDVTLWTIILNSLIGLESFKSLLMIRSNSPGEDIYLISASSALRFTADNLKFGNQRIGSCSAALSRIDSPRFGGAPGSILNPSLEASV